MRLRAPSGLKALFLHWGPGCNSEVERRWFGDQPDFDFWDQPKFSGPGAFDKTVQAARMRLEKNFKDAGGPIHLMAHSFGGMYIRHLVEEASEKISGITLISCSSDPWLTYVRFAEHLSRFNPALKKMAADANRTRNAEKLWGLIQACMQIQDFRDHYWKNPSARARHSALSEGVEFLDFPVFQSIMNEFVGPVRPLKELSLAAGIKVRCVLGESDPMVDATTEGAAWKRIFPRCEVSIIPGAAHFVHFESAFEKWLI